MVEIRRSANRSSGMAIPRVVSRWIVNEASAIAPRADEWKPPYLDRAALRLFAELLTEASQRPEFVQWAEHCQTAALKSDTCMKHWIRTAYRYERRKSKPLNQPISNHLDRKSTYVARRIVNRRNDYKVTFQAVATAAGFNKTGVHLGQTEREPVFISRCFPTLELAISYRDRVEKAISDPCNRTAKEKAAAAFSIPLYESANFQPTE